MGESKRKAFNFFHSYYDVGKELNDKDRLQFYDALLKKQFENINSELTGMAKFAYISQSHSIESQIKGYFDKTKDPIFDPCQGGSVGGLVGGAQGGSVAPPVQGEEKEKEQVQHVNIDFDAMLVFINKTFGRNFKTISPKVKAKYNARLKEKYSTHDIRDAMLNCLTNQFHKDNNFQYCTPEYFSRSEIIDKYSKVTKVNETKEFIYDPVVEQMEYLNSITPKTYQP
jgi:hypothetical protein